MLLLFCRDPLNTSLPDDAYQAEAAAAERPGLPFSLLNFEALVHENDPEQAVKHVRRQPTEVLALYRGWMLRPEDYRRLFEVLLGRGVRLLNDPAATAATSPSPTRPSKGHDMPRVAETLRRAGHTFCIGASYDTASSYWSNSTFR